MRPRIFLGLRLSQWDPENDSHHRRHLRACTYSEPQARLQVESALKAFFVSLPAVSEGKANLGESVAEVDIAFFGQGSVAPRPPHLRTQASDVIESAANR